MSATGFIFLPPWGQGSGQHRGRSTCWLGAPSPKPQDPQQVCGQRSGQGVPVEVAEPGADPRAPGLAPRHVSVPPLEPAHQIVGQLQHPDSPSLALPLPPPPRRVPEPPEGRPSPRRCAFGRQEEAAGLSHPRIPNVPTRGRSLPPIAALGRTTVPQPAPSPCGAKYAGCGGGGGGAELEPREGEAQQAEIR